MKGFSYLRNVATLKLNIKKCIGCGRCLEVCPHQVFSLAEKKAIITNFDACMECGACAINCPSTAIFVDSGVGCATGLINEWIHEQKMFSARKKCC
ncbi:MAG: 4Fe-4S dicluster domain-containing protein [Desulfobacterium sp.]|nr:4Fe-4S dicluster domain-containing protein [Desulfobacterium sp.]MBU3946674.1 4Fe-4S binding protein [Pseudomonadota bacterium]MBU4010206.1 4Fe-4S binding protein [Pseudomonadota bacterium]MBU4036533.1 4Fe-4S binding protein [Pseudomonadota bacterium]